MSRNVRMATVTVTKNLNSPITCPWKCQIHLHGEHRFVLECRLLQGNVVRTVHVAWILSPENISFAHSPRMLSLGRFSSQGCQVITYLRQLVTEHILGINYHCLSWLNVHVNQWNYFPLRTLKAVVSFLLHELQYTTLNRQYYQRSLRFYLFQGKNHHKQINFFKIFLNT